MLHVRGSKVRMASMDRNEQHTDRGTASLYHLSPCIERQQTHISEEVQAQIDRTILQSRQEAEKCRLKYEESQRELREVRRELISVKEENEALRFQAALHEEEFRTELNERRRTQTELQRVRAQLQQQQRQIEGREGLQYLREPTYYDHHKALSHHFMRVGIDVCDNGKSDTADDPAHDHTRLSPAVNAGGLRQPPVAAIRTNSLPTEHTDKQGHRTTTTD